jgi:hypothetical protein
VTQGTNDPTANLDRRVVHISRNILDELRALRGDFNTFAREHGERVSVLETDVHSLVGNGRPGRVDRLESAVQRLKQWQWRLVGIFAGVSGVASVLAWVVTEVRK